MSDDAFRQALDGIEARIVAGGARDGALALAYLAAQLVAVDEVELAAARRGRGRSPQSRS